MTRRTITLSNSYPTIVCLCGSTKFWREFQSASLRETMAGRVVLSIGAASGTDDEHFGNLLRSDYEAVKARLDELHKRKIDLADEVLVLNVGGYIGPSTASEVAHATDQRKPIRWLEPGLNFSGRFHLMEAGVPVPDGMWEASPTPAGGEQ